MKWKVTWWIHGVGRICRGHDILEVEELDEDNVIELIEEDLGRNLSDPASTTHYKYDFPSPFVPNLPNFHAKHRELITEDRHSEVSNFGVLRVIPLRDDRKVKMKYPGVDVGNETKIERNRKN